MSEYRNHGVCTIDELRAATAEAEAALAAPKAAFRAAAESVVRAELVCKAAGWSTLVGVFATPLVALSHGSPVTVRTLGAVTIVSAIVAAVFFALAVRADLEFKIAARVHRKALSEWHRAFSRENCEESRLESGYNGRCACEECEADPLGFFGPYRKDGVS